MLTIKMLEFVLSKRGIIATKFEFRIFRFVDTIFLVFFLKNLFLHFRTVRFHNKNSKHSRPMTAKRHRQNISIDEDSAKTRCGVGWMN